MIKILFICHGNICRSPMAEYIMKHLVEAAGVAKQFEIASAATSTEEIGNDIYPPAKRKLTEHGIPFGRHAARQLRQSDYKYYDYLIGMDSANMRNISRICGCDCASGRGFGQGFDRASSRSRLGLSESSKSDASSDSEPVIAMLMDYTDTPGSVSDPWYTDDFETTYQDVLAGCKGLLEYIDGK